MYSRSVAILFLLLLLSCSQHHDYTIEERSYIATHTIMWCARSTSEPFEFLDNNGVMQGMSVDYLNLISEKTGVRIKISHKTTMDDFRCPADTRTISLFNLYSTGCLCRHCDDKKYRQS